MKNKRTVVLDLDEQDLIKLRTFSHIPDWISEEFFETFGPCNCAPLPLLELRKILKQIDEDDSCACGHLQRDHCEGICKKCDGEFPCGGTEE